MNKNEFDTGISSEVFTLKSNFRLIDIFNQILEKKASAVRSLFKDLLEDNIINKESSIVIIGTYFTGIAVAKYLSADNFKNITVVDIYPHLEGFIDSPLGDPISFSSEISQDDANMDNDFFLQKIKGNINNVDNDFFLQKIKGNIKFSSDLDLIINSDVVIDTTGLGGINESQSKSINAKVFLIEDPIAEDNDTLLKNKNNIYDRANLVNSERKFVLKTLGLNTKTSGTMTFAIDILRQSMNRILSMEGVLYCASEMTFYEEIIFKQKDLDKFFSLIGSPVIKVSTISIFGYDEIIEGFLDKIYSEILEVC